MAYAQCGDGQSNTTDSHWLSCEIADNPNSVRNPGHWILYDLGYDYNLTTSTIWNYNVENETGKGFKDVIIDYSNNGITWNELGAFQWPQANGESEYTGFEGPDFDGTTIRYVLISAINTWDDQECAGFAEVQFNIDRATATNEQEYQNSKLKIYPNPANDIIKVELDQMPLSILEFRTITGKLIKRVNCAQKTNDYFDISFLMPGVYILNAYSRNEILSHRLVKQ